MSITRRRDWTLLVCHSCGYTEVSEDGSWLTGRSLSDNWCGHDRDAFHSVKVSGLVPEDIA